MTLRFMDQNTWKIRTICTSVEVQKHNNNLEILFTRFPNYMLPLLTSYDPEPPSTMIGIIYLEWTTQF